MSREPVLVDDPDEIARHLRAHPGVWFLVARGPLERHNTIKQTGYRIRTNRLRAFRRNSDPRGRWEVRTTAALDREDAVAPVEMVARWVSLG